MRLLWRNMTALIDTNIILDVFLKRIPFYEMSYKILNMCKNGSVNGIISAHSVSNIWYISRKDFNDDERRTLIKTLFDCFEVSSFNKQKLLSAIDRTDFSAFEDCLQDECAKEFDADFIVTRNVKDFAHSNVKAVSPEEFIQLAG